MARSSSFEVISLGDLAVVDTSEDNTIISRENGEALLGTYGSATDPLSDHIHMLDPGSTGYAGGNNASAYQSSDETEAFTIDGGPEQIYDGAFKYSGSVKYTDGTTATLDQFIIFQDTAGNTYLAPFDITAGTPLGAKPIESITLDKLLDTTAYSLPGQQEADRFVGDPPDPADNDPSTVFDVIHLGQLPDMDTVEGDNNATTANVEAIAGKTYGSKTDPLFKDIHRFAPGSTGFSGGIADGYDIDNNHSNDTFTINGGPDQTHDVTMLFRATVTYVDGSTSDEFIASVAQDTDGNAYLDPRKDTSAFDILHAKPIQSITLGDPVYGSNDPTAAGYYLVGAKRDNQFVNCFTTGTLILTDRGERRVEELKVGDRVITADHGPQKIRWIGVSPVTGAQLRANDKLRPIRFAAGSLAPGLPRRDLTVSRQHRMLVTSKIAERVSGTAEILIPAKDFLDLPGVRMLTPEECPRVTYYHLLLDRHEVLIAEEVPSESFFLGAQATALLTPEEMAEVARYFAQLEGIGLPDMAPARQFVRGGPARRIVARHMRNAKPFVRQLRLAEPAL